MATLSPSLIDSVSLYPLTAAVQNGLQTSSVASLLAVSHSLEETVMRHQLDGVFFAGFQRFSAFLPQAARMRTLAARCRKVYIFGVPDAPVPAIPNLEYVEISSQSPLAQEWFIIFQHEAFSAALLTRQLGTGTAGAVRRGEFGRGQLYQGLITFQQEIVQPAHQLLCRLTGTPAEPVSLLNTSQPISTYMQEFSGYMERANAQIVTLYNNLSERTATLERMEAIVRTMVSRRAWDDSLQMLESPAPDNDVPVHRKLSILFTDIQNFTPLFERQDPLELTKELNHYFNLLATIIYEHHGDIDKFLGDGLMAFFTNPRDAVDAALEMQLRLDYFNRQQAAHLRTQLNTRIGIASGECMVARLGSSSRREITIIGDAVNLSSRIQTLAPVNGLGMDEASYQEVGRPPQYLGRDVQVKGKGYQRIYTADFTTIQQFSPSKTRPGKNS